MDRKNDMPLWVWLGLLNIETRKGALILFGASLVAAVICIPVSMYMDDWSWAGLMFAVTLWYGLSILWVDRKAAW